MRGEQIESLNFCKSPTGMAGVLGGNRPGAGQAARRIDEAHDVASKTVTNTLDGIHRQALKGRGVGSGGFPGLRASSDGSGTAPRVQTSGGETHLDRARGR